jgi:flagellin|tara:strand:- start:290 stop:2143 length:1854 start_codon:yes stop_codon:yes gene_type:complete
MPQVINTNIASLNAQRNLNASQGQANVALERLSSGLRINSAKDDAAGLAISERFQSQIAGLNQAQRNANDGISLAQTAEGAMDEITNNLQRIRELAVQSANATNSISDRQALNQEVQQRIEEINRIAAQTSFNGLKVLDGTFATQTFQVGANTGETIAISGLDSRGSQIGSVLKETSGLSSFEIAPAGSVDTEIDISGSGLDLTGSQNITGTVNINGVDVEVNAANAAGAGDIATAINAGISTAKAATGYNGELDDITVAGDNTTNVITFTNAATSDTAVDFNLSDDSIAAAQSDDFTGQAITAGNSATDTIDLSNFDFTNGGTLTIAGVTDPIEIADNQTLEQVRATIQAELRAATADPNLTATLDGSNVLSINAVTTDVTVPDFTIASNAVGNTYNPAAQTIDAALSEALTLESAFANGETFDFTVDINGTGYSFEGLTSLNDIVSQINAKSNDTGIQANLNANNDEIFFSSQFGEPFTIDIQADLDADGTFDATTETLQSVVSTVEDNTVSMSDIDISTRDGADLAMIAVDYAIDTINGFRAELGAVQNRFESTIANLATTSENLSASNSRIRDADFAAESAELARTQVLQQAGLSVLAQANARPQQVLQLLQG